MDLKKTLKEIKFNKAAYLYLLPALVFLLAVIGYPLIVTIKLSFYRDIGFGAIHDFVGFANYLTLIKDPEFWEILRRTLIWTVSSVVLKTFLGLVGALLLNQQFVGRGLFRALILPPWIIPLPIGAYVWTWLYNGQYGLINGILLKIGIIDKPFEMLAYPLSAFIGCIINDVWVGLPFMTLVILAGLQAIPNELYEAARVDGAQVWQKFWYITLPQLKTILLIATLLSTVWTFNSFDIIWVQTGGGPLSATTTLVIETYKTAFGRFDFGMASALAVIAFMVLIFASIIYSRFILLEE